MPQEDIDRINSIDTSHVIALTKRVGELATSIALLIDRQTSRDDNIASLRLDISTLRSDFAKSSFTQEEMVHIRSIVEADSRAKWLWASVRLYVYWLASVATGIYMLRDWIALVLKKLSA
jgi:hypothetical protein